MEIGTIETKDKSVSGDYAKVNSAFPVSDVPTDENSKRKTDQSALGSGQEAPAKVGDACC
jgi:hypothetical protein